MHWINGWSPELFRILITFRTIVTGWICSVSEDLSEADRQIQKQYDLLEKGIYDEVTFFERSAIMKKRKSELTSRLK